MVHVVIEDPQINVKCFLVYSVGGEITIQNVFPHIEWVSKSHENDLAAILVLELASTRGGMTVWY